MVAAWWLVWRWIQLWLEEFPVFWIIDCREDCWAYRLVVCCGVMLGEVICQVLCARSPVITELSLGVAAP